MEKAKIDRINELAKKQKASGLTDAELDEQKALRAEYLEAIKANITAAIENTTFEYPDGSTFTPKKNKEKKNCPLLRGLRGEGSS